MSRTCAGRSRCDPFRGSYTAGSSSQPGRRKPRLTSRSSKRQPLPRNLQAIDCAQDRGRQPIVAKQVARHALDIVACDLLDALKRFIEPELAIVVDLLPRQMRHPDRTALAFQHQSSLELVLYTL